MAKELTNAEKMKHAERLLEAAWDRLQQAEDYIDEAVDPTMKHKFYAWAHDANINITKLRNLTSSPIYRKED